MKLQQRLSTLVVASLLVGSVSTVAMTNVEGNVLAKSYSTSCTQSTTTSSAGIVNPDNYTTTEAAAILTLQNLKKDMGIMQDFVKRQNLVSYAPATIMNSEGDNLIYQGIITTSGGTVVINNEAELISPDTGNIIFDQDKNFYVDGKKIVFTNEDLVQAEDTLVVNAIERDGRIILIDAIDDTTEYVSIAKLYNETEVLFKDGNNFAKITRQEGLENLGWGNGSIRFNNAELHYDYNLYNDTVLKYPTQIAYSENRKWMYTIKENEIMCSYPYAIIKGYENVNSIKIPSTVITTAAITTVKLNGETIVTNDDIDIVDVNGKTIIDAEGNIYAPNSNNILISKDGTIYDKDGTTYLIDNTGNLITQSKNILEILSREGYTTIIVGDEWSSSTYCIGIYVGIENNILSIQIRNSINKEEINITFSEVVNNEPQRATINFNNGIIIEKYIEKDDNEQDKPEEGVKPPSEDNKEPGDETTTPPAVKPGDETTPPPEDENKPEPPKEDVPPVIKPEQPEEPIKPQPPIVAPPAFDDDDDDYTSGDSSSSSSSSSNSSSNNSSSSTENKDDKNNTANDTTTPTENSKDQAIAKVKELSTKVSQETAKVLASNATLIKVQQPQVQKLAVALNGKGLTLKDSILNTNERTFLPIRAIAEALDATVGFNAQSKVAIVSKNGVTIELPANRNVAIINGTEVVKIDSENDKVGTFIQNGRTYLPIRFIAEHLGLNVDYTATTITFTEITK